MTVIYNRDIVTHSNSLAQDYTHLKKKEKKMRHK